MSKILKNTTNAAISLKELGILLQPNSSFIVQEQDYLLLSYKASVNEIAIYIDSGAIIVNDGEDDLLNKRVAIALIQDNQVVLSEYYTLVQDDDVLIGNGQILYLNDDFDTAGDIPLYLYNEQLEEDDDY